MSKFERKSYLVSLLALLVSVGSLILGYIAIQASWQITELSGGFDKPNVEVGIGEQALASGKPNFVFIGANTLSLENTQIVIGAVPFTFTSSGKKSLDSLSISFQYQKLFQRELLEAADTKISGAFTTIGVRKSTSSDLDNFYVSYSTERLNPGVSLHIAEPIFLSETYAKGTVASKTKDGVDVSVAYGIDYSIAFGMVVSTPDNAVQPYTVQISVQQATSLKELASGRVGEHVVRRQKLVRSELGFFSYLATLVTSSPTETAHLVYVPLKRITQGKKSILYGESPQETALVTYPLLTWRRLFYRGET